MEILTKPDDDEQRTWHVHETDQTWDWGAVCEKCAATRPNGEPSGPMFNIARLRADNAGHYTQNMIAREIRDEADRTGREIEKA